jgi:uncharacterized FlaG/YvyC family protein
MNNDYYKILGVNENSSQDEIKNAVNVIQEFIHLIVNGIEVVRDDHGISSVRIVDHQSKRLIRELEPDELLAVLDRINRDVNQKNTQAFALIIFNNFISCSVNIR